jgi:hypothetical protein
MPRGQSSGRYVLKGAQVAASQRPDVEWRKSSVSNSGGCVQIAAFGQAVAVRDSKDPARSMLTVSPAAWAAFIGRTRQLGPAAATD